MNNPKPVIIFLMKLLVSTGLIVFFLTQIHIERFLGTLLSARFSYIALALVVYLVSQILSAGRWMILARPLGFRNHSKRSLLFISSGCFLIYLRPELWAGMSAGFTIWPAMTRHIRKRRAGLSQQFPPPFPCSWIALWEWPCSFGWAPSDL